MRRTGILIVTCNSERHIDACLRSARSRCDNIVVVDNSSRDGTRRAVQQHRGVRLIANEHNRGFAAAVNQGIEVLDCDLVLLLNPDAELLTGIADLASTCAAESVAAATGKLVDEDGRPQRSYNVRRFPTPATLVFEILGWNRLLPHNPVNRHYRCLDLDLEQPGEVDQPAGAFLMLRRDVWRRLGGFDERFHPVFFEEVDFLRRARMSGYSVQYLPSVIARHKGAHSVGQLDRGCRDLYWYGSLLKYAWKHFGHAGREIVCVAVILGSVLRMFVGIVSERRLRPALAYSRIIRLAAKQTWSCWTRGAQKFTATDVAN